MSWMTNSTTLPLTMTRMEDGLGSLVVHMTFVFFRSMVIVKLFTVDSSSEAWAHNLSAVSESKLRLSP